MNLDKWIRFALSLLLSIGGASAGYFYFNQSQPPPNIPISKLGQDLQLGNVKRISVDGTRRNITYLEGVTAIVVQGQLGHKCRKAMRLLTACRNVTACGVVDIEVQRSSADWH